MKIHRILCATAVLCTGLFSHAAMAADQYPSRPITLIVPWGAGGGTDTLARTFAEELQKELKQTVNVVNQTGGGGVIGHSAISKARTDGYTLGVGTVEITTYRALGQADLGADSFTILRRLAALPGGITVNSKQPWATAADFVEDIRKQPETTYSASGCSLGCSWQLALAGLLDRSGIDPKRVRFIPSTGGAQALQEVVAGGVTVYPGSLGEGKSLVQADMVKQLVVMSGSRLPSEPNVPTVKEALGFDWEAGSWFVFLGPKDLPDALRKKIEAAAEKASRGESYRKFLKDRGFLALDEAPDQSKTIMLAEEENSKALIAKLGLGKN